METVTAPKQPKGKGKGKGKTTVKSTDTVRVVSKKKITKPKANPFRRSDTDKLQLKKLQMTKRVETQTPKVTLMRERFELAQSRLSSVSAKLLLVEAELASRKEKVVEEAEEGKPEEDYESSELSGDEDLADTLELDDEVEDDCVKI